MSEKTENSRVNLLYFAALPELSEYSGEVDQVLIDKLREESELDDEELIDRLGTLIEILMIAKGGLLEDQDYHQRALDGLRSHKPARHRLGRN